VAEVGSVGPSGIGDEDGGASTPGDAVAVGDTVGAAVPRLGVAGAADPCVGVAVRVAVTPGAVVVVGVLALAVGFGLGATDAAGGVMGGGPPLPKENPTTVPGAGSSSGTAVDA
jgi:hypothetical protein